MAAEKPSVVVPPESHPRSLCVRVFGINSPTPPSVALQCGDAWVETSALEHGDETPPFRQAIRGVRDASSSLAGTAIYVAAHSNKTDEQPQQGSPTKRSLYDLTSSPTDMSLSLHDISVGSLDTVDISTGSDATAATAEQLLHPTFVLHFKHSNDRVALALVVNGEELGSTILVAHRIPHVLHRGLALDRKDPHVHELPLSSAGSSGSPRSLVVSAFWLDDEFSSKLQLPRSNAADAGPWVRAARGGLPLLRYPWLSSPPHATGAVFGQGRVARVRALYTVDHVLDLPPGVEKVLQIAEVELADGQDATSLGGISETSGEESSGSEISHASSGETSGGSSGDGDVDGDGNGDGAASSAATPEALDPYSVQNGYVIVRLDDEVFWKLQLRKWTPQRVVTAIQSLARARAAQGRFRSRADEVRGIPASSTLAVRSANVTSHRLRRMTRRDGGHLQPFYRVVVRSRRGPWWACERTFEQCWTLEQHVSRHLHTADQYPHRARFPSRYGRRDSSSSCIAECIDPTELNEDRRQAGLDEWLGSLVVAGHTNPTLADFLAEFLEAEGEDRGGIGGAARWRQRSGRRRRLSVFEEPPPRRGADLRDGGVSSSAFLAWWVVCGL